MFSGIRTHNILLWAACCTAYFGFLRPLEVAVPSQTTFDPSMHLSLQDVAVDSELLPKIISISIKHSKADLMQQGHNSYQEKTLSGESNNILPGSHSHALCEHENDLTRCMVI